MVLAAVGCLAVLLGTAGGATGDLDPRDEARKDRIAMYSGGASLAIARRLNVNEIMGKAIPAPVDDPGPDTKAGADDFATKQTHAYPQTDNPPSSPNNTAIRYFPKSSENEPTVVANPKDSDKLVAGMHFYGDQGVSCVAHYSRNGGKSWNSIPIFMRQLTYDSTCSDPVLAYEPDGSRVYYAYMDIKFTTFDILVSYSDDDGKSWKGPVIALSNPAADYDKPWIGTHVAGGGGGSNCVYVSATRFDFTGPCHIDFARSSNKGTAWSPPQTLDSSVGCGSGPSPVVQGSRPTGGRGGDVLVAWYHSGADGWLNGNFQIRTRHSANNGAAFSPFAVAAADSFELPFWLGPFANYHRWWGGMFPDVEIAPNGSGHIAYTHDPVAGTATAEDGNIRYTGSAGPPYTAWSAPATANGDASGKAQGWATLEADSSGNQAQLYAIWEDHRNSTLDNAFYDIFWAKKVGSGAWSNAKLTDEDSPSDFIFVGDYYDITIAGGGDGKDSTYSKTDDDDRRFVYGV